MVQALLFEKWSANSRRASCCCYLDKDSRKILKKNRATCDYQRSRDPHYFSRYHTIFNVSDPDSAVSLYDLQSFELQEQLTKTKGATVFAITSNIEKDSNGVPTIISRLAISAKRKLLIYSWHDAELLEPEV